MEKILIAYVPVLHDGYKMFFERHKDAKTIYIFGPEIIGEFYYLSKEIRQLDPKLIKAALESWKLKSKIEILTPDILKSFENKKYSIVMPNEDVVKILWEKYFPKQQVTLDSIFLRWDKHNAVLEKPVIPDEMLSKKAFDKKIMKLSEKEAEKSSDWWRRVGAVLVKNGKVVMQAYNAGAPSEHTPYVNGDPRNAFNKGVHLELGTTIHAEAGIIAEAARKGIKLDGSDMYVSVFPCPPCAKLIAYSGIKTLYCGGGYGILDGENVLKAKGVKIIFVEHDEEVIEKAKNKTWKGYKK
jgi:dCMP deaminase